MVEIEKLPEGGYRVSRVLPCGPSMQAAASALERINPDAFKALPVTVATEGWCGNPPSIELRD